MTDRDPRHGLEAIALLAHLYADEDGPLSIQDDPDADLRELLLHIESRADYARPVDFDAKALALVSCAIDLLRCAEVDALDTPTPKAEKPISKAIRHLERAAWMLTPSAPRADAQVLRAVAKDIWPDDDREADLRRMVERIVGPVEWSAPVPKSEPGTPEAVTAGTAALTDLMRTPAVGSIYGDVDWEKIPVGTVALVPSGTVYVRCHKWWDIARVLGGWSTPDLDFSAFSPDCATLIHIGDGTLPDDYAEVRRIVEAWEAAHPKPT